MRTVVLGKSGLEVAAVGFGGIPIMRVDTDQAVRTIRRALDLGVNFIDSAIGYGDSEVKVGQAIKSRRDGLVLASKSRAQTRADVLRDVDRSRAAMGADVIDLYQLHNCSTEAERARILAPGGALEGLVEARDAGRIGHIGVTSHNLAVAIKLLDEPAFETIMFPFNLVTREPADELIPKARGNNVGFIVMKPLCGGQYDNARLAFKFLNGWPDLLTLPGIEKPGEIEQIVEIVSTGEPLAGAELAEAERIADRLGKLFCRRCGYCQPCPQDVPIQLAMVFRSFEKRFPRQELIRRFAVKVAQQGAQCIECGLCETKCPYHLPIIETVKKSTARAKEIISES